MGSVGSWALSAQGFKRSSSLEYWYSGSVSEASCSFLGLGEHIFVARSFSVAKSIPVKKVQCHVIDSKSLKIFRKNRFERQCMDLMHALS